MLEYPRLGFALLAYCYLEIENNAARLNIPPGVALYVACITLLELRGAGPQRCKLCTAPGLNRETSKDIAFPNGKQHQELLASYRAIKRKKRILHAID